MRGTFRKLDKSLECVLLRYWETVKEEGMDEERQNKRQKAALEGSEKISQERKKSLNRKSGCF